MRSATAASIAIYHKSTLPSKKIYILAAFLFMDYMIVQRKYQHEFDTSCLFSTILCFCLHGFATKTKKNITETDVTDPPKVTISTTHTARIINEYGQEKTAFTATFNQQQWKAEKNGVVVFEAKKINKYGEKMTIKDDKGFNLSILISGHENDINYSVLTILTIKKPRHLHTTIRQHWT
ncbi:MAG: hypothetical protein IPN46_19575 [Saprospiraceae bacterium]|nr:hypothetical protein [Saprospiraceae bacterium]